jgi:hypothetical protein
MAAPQLAAQRVQKLGGVRMLARAALRTPRVRAERAALATWPGAVALRVKVEAATPRAQADAAVLQAPAALAAAGERAAAPPRAAAAPY